MSLDDPISDSGWRKTVSVRFKTAASHRIQVLAQTLFDGAIVGAVEASFFEYCIAHGYFDRGGAPLPTFPSEELLKTSQGVGACVDDFLLVADTLSDRLESLASRGRIAVVDPELVLAFVRAAATFPGPVQPFSGGAKVHLVDTDATSFTLLPQHIALIDSVGMKLFGRDRKRRAVVEEAFIWFGEQHGLSDVAHDPTFSKYPDVALVNLNRYFTRHVRSLLAAMIPLADSVGRFRLWSSIEEPFTAATFRLGNALFNSVRRDRPADP